MDGEIIVADRLSDRKHWTVRDHNGRPLSLDLVGVKKYARALPPVFDEPAPFLQQRVKSDGAVPTKASKFDTQIDRPRHPTGDNSKNLKKIDDDAEPALHNSSIPIQGHINCGMVRFNEVKKAWLLHIDNGLDFDIEAYPDTIPGSIEKEHPTQFVVLSAKKVVRPKSEVFDATPEDSDNDEEIDIEGHGILLEDVSTPHDGHYRRTGALRFRVATVEVFHTLLVTVGSEGLTAKEFDPKRGRKFWLD